MAKLSPKKKPAAKKTATPKCTRGQTRGYKTQNQAKRESPPIDSVNFTASSLDSKALAAIEKKLSPKPAAKKAPTATPKRAQKFLKETSKQSKRGDEVDFADLTHQVVFGVYEGFAGEIVPEEEVDTYRFGGMKITDDKNDEMKQHEGEVVTLRLFKNKRGNKQRESRLVTFKKSEVEELGVYDMLQYVGNEDDELEDEGLVEAEKKQWICARCNHKNTHDASYCEMRKYEFGTSCGEARAREGTSQGWAGCFGRMNKLWICKECTSPNEESLTSCKACNAARPGVEGNIASEGSPTETGAQGCISGSGFTFPVANKE